jgi:hypothetical protein
VTGRASMRPAAVIVSALVVVVSVVLAAAGCATELTPVDLVAQAPPPPAPGPYGCTIEIGPLNGDARLWSDYCTANPADGCDVFDERDGYAQELDFCSIKSVCRIDCVVDADCPAPDSGTAVATCLHDESSALGACRLPCDSVYDAATDHFVSVTCPEGLECAAATDGPYGWFDECVYRYVAACAPDQNCCPTRY